MGLKAITSLTNWVSVLKITKPDKWSVNAVLDATIVFTTSEEKKMSQSFFSTILLPRIRKNIRENRKIHSTLYQALKKSLNRPVAFFGGIILPSCKLFNCTLRDTVILSCLINRASIPASISLSALLQLIQMPFNTKTEIFIRVLLNKTHTFPSEIIEILVNHFSRYRKETCTLPVIWPQNLLTFLNRNDSNVSEKSRQELKLLVKTQHHRKISNIILQKLTKINSKNNLKS